MTRLPPLATLLAGALLAACSSSPQRPPAATGDGRCDAEPVQYLLEQRITTDLAEQARLQSGAAHLRVTHPHQPTTLDYDPQRLNIHIDDDDSIVRLNCG